MDSDPYATLGLTKTATDAEIKKAYLKLVRTSHPDINPGDPEAEARFKQITSAYGLLKDPETRARFDAGEIDAAGHETPKRSYYRDFAEAEGDHRTGWGPAGEQDLGGMSPDDIFAEFLRQRAGGRQGFAVRGPDHGFALEVPFLDAARGGTARIALPDGESLDVAIPAGLKDGQTLRLRGKGGEGRNSGPRGDALVTVSVRPHPVFRRDGDDILVILPITFDEAVLGARVQTPTIHGEVALTIPKGSSSGKTLRLRGRGVKRKSVTGDQLVELRIMAPKTDDPKLSEFLEEWRKDRTDDPRTEMLKEASR